LEFLGSEVLLDTVVVVVNALDVFVLVFVGSADSFLVEVVLVLGVDLVIVEFARVEFGNGDVAGV
jgi:hypothetical protein